MIDLICLNAIYILHYVIYMLQFMRKEGSVSLINRVKIARVQAGLTQQQLADKTGVTRQTISLIEKGAYNPSLNLCLDICYAVHATLNDLFWVPSGGIVHEEDEG